MMGSPMWAKEPPDGEWVGRAWPPCRPLGLSLPSAEGTPLGWALPSGLVTRTLVVVV
jgi:hypothetical protein